MKLLKNILTYMFISPIIIIMFPFIVIHTLIDLKRYNIKKRFHFLIDEGFIIKKEKVFNNVYYFIRKPIFIKINQDVEYKISYDNGKNYINIYDSEIGTLEERKKLLEVIIEYQGSHTVDRQRGDAIDTAKYFISFLQKYVSSLE